MSEEEFLKKEKWRLFALSFAGTFLVIGLMAVATVYWLAPPAPDTPEAPMGDGVYLPAEEDSFSMLVVGEDQESGMLTFALVGFYPTRGNMPVAVLPRETLLVGKNNTDTLEGVYRTGGAAYAKAALEACFEISIDRYAAVRAEGFVKVADTVGVTDFDLPVELTGQNGLVRLAAGRQQLDGQKTVEILSYPSYPEGELQRCRVSAQVIAAVINTHLPLVDSPAADPVFGLAVDNADTDLNQVDYQQRKQAASFMARLDVKPAQTISITGSYNGAGNTFSPTEAAKTALKAAFGQ